MTPLERHLRKWTEKAIADFRLIEPGDGVAAGVSGGKDSLAMLRLLSGPFVQASSDFRLVAMHVDIGIPGSDAHALEDYFKSLGVEYRIISARGVFEEAHREGAKKRPCFTCSRLRRRAIIEAAKELGCGKIAFAHHRDDVVETLMMNMFFNREISGMVPKQELFDGSFSIIRPLYYIREKMVARFARSEGLPAMKAKCPAEDVSRRRIVKDMLREMEKTEKHLNENIFRSSFRVLDGYMPHFDGKIELPRPR